MNEKIYYVCSDVKSSKIDYIQYTSNENPSSLLLYKLNEFYW